MVNMPSPIKRHITVSAPISQSYLQSFNVALRIATTSSCNNSLSPNLCALGYTVFIRGAVLLYVRSHTFAALFAKVSIGSVSEMIPIDWQPFEALTALLILHISGATHIRLGRKIYVLLRH